MEGIKGDQFSLFYFITGLKIKQQDLKDFVSIRKFKSKQKLLLKVIRCCLRLFGDSDSKFTNEELI